MSFESLGHDPWRETVSEQPTHEHGQAADASAAVQQPGSASFSRSSAENNAHQPLVEPLNASMDAYLLNGIALHIQETASSRAHSERPAASPDTLPHNNINITDNASLPLLISPMLQQRSDNRRRSSTLFEPVNVPPPHRPQTQRSPSTATSVLKSFMRSFSHTPVASSAPHIYRSRSRTSMLADADTAAILGDAHHDDYNDPDDHAPAASSASRNHEYHLGTHGGYYKLDNLGGPSTAKSHEGNASQPDARSPTPMFGVDGSNDQIQDLMLPYDDFTTIDWMRDWVRDHRRKQRLAANHVWPGSVPLSSLFETSQSWLLVSITGIFIGTIAALIDISTSWLTDFRQGICSTDWRTNKDVCCRDLVRSGGYCDAFVPWGFYLFATPINPIVNFVIYTTLSIAMAALAATLVSYFSSYAAGSGTAEIKTILGGFIIKRFLGIRTLIVKFLALPLTVASGLAVGKEGPMIHIACCIGNLFPRFFPKYKNNEARKREVLSAAAAAGVAVAFGAPIGGILFSLEELSTFFPNKTMVRSFFCALVSSVVLQLINPYHGKRVMFQVPASRNWYYFEMISFVILGVLGGLMGAIVIRGSLWMQAVRRRYAWFRQYPIREIVLISVLTASIGYVNIYTRVNSSELLEYLFRECQGDVDEMGLCNTSQLGVIVASLMFALIFKTVFTIVTIGARVPAGIFIPSMVWGALFGRILGIGVQQWQMANPDLPLFADCPRDKPCVTPGMYALLGATAGLGGVTKLTVSLTVVMFELTGTLNYIIPCMVTVTVAKLVGDLFMRGGMAEVNIRVNRFPFLDPREDEVIGIPVSEAMTNIDHLVCLTRNGMTWGDIEALLESHDFQGFPIVHSMTDPIIIGYITRSDLLYGISRAGGHQPVSVHTIVYFDEPGNWISSTRSESPRNGRRTGRSRSPVSATLTRRGGTGSPTQLGALSDTYGSEEDHDATITAAPTAGSINIAKYVDQTPLGIDPRVPIELAIDLFKKLGPRMILIKQAGRLKGLITKKDLLATIYTREDVVAAVGLRPGKTAETLFADTGNALPSATLSVMASVRSSQVLSTNDSVHVSHTNSTDGLLN